VLTKSRVLDRLVYTVFINEKLGTATELRKLRRLYQLNDDYSNM
jgi:hypothetical protein